MKVTISLCVYGNSWFNIIFKFAKVKLNELPKSHEMISERFKLECEMEDDLIGFDMDFEDPNGEYDETDETKVTRSKLSLYSELVSKFGSQTAYKNAEKLVRVAIMSASVYNPVVNARTHRTLVEAIENAFERISNSPYINRPGLSPLADKEIFDQVMKRVLPEFMVSDRMIEEVFSSNYDTKDIDIKKNLSKGLQLIIKSLPKHSFRFVRAKIGRASCRERV